MGAALGMPKGQGFHTPTSDFERFESSPRKRRRLSIEQVKLEMTELICWQMDRRKISRLKLAKAIGLTVRQLRNRLNGQGLTLETFSDMCWALNIRPGLTCVNHPRYRRTYALK